MHPSDSLHPRDASTMDATLKRNQAQLDKFVQATSESFEANRRCFEIFSSDDSTIEFICPPNGRSVSGSTADISMPSANKSSVGRTFSSSSQASSQTSIGQSEEDLRDDLESKDIENIHTMVSETDEPRVSRQLHEGDGDAETNAGASHEVLNHPRDGNPVAIQSSEVTNWHSHKEDEICCFPSGLESVTRNLPTSYEDECPYEPGKTLHLNIESPTDKCFHTIEVTIIKVFKPFSLSCTMVVSSNHSLGQHGDQMILKMYDRRFAEEIRKEDLKDTDDWKWSKHTEAEYINGISTGKAAELACYLSNEYDEDFGRAWEYEDPWDQVSSEVLMWCSSRKIFQDEVEAYDRLKDLQGNGMPRLFSKVLKSVSDSIDDPFAPSVMTDIPGILIEYFNSIPMSEFDLLKASVPREEWAHMCEDAVHVARSLTSVGICNTDACARNALVYYDADMQRHRSVMIDFGQVLFRRSENDMYWLSQKAQKCEEDAIGWYMSRKLEGEYVFHRSKEADRLDPDFLWFYNSYDDEYREHYWSRECDQCGLVTCPKFEQDWEERLNEFHRTWNDHRSLGCADCQDELPCDDFGKPWAKAHASRGCREMAGDVVDEDESSEAEMGSEENGGSIETHTHTEHQAPRLDQRWKDGEGSDDFMDTQFKTDSATWVTVV